MAQTGDKPIFYLQFHYKSIMMADTVKLTGDYFVFRDSKVAGDMPVNSHGLDIGFSYVIDYWTIAFNADRAFASQ
jgi:hypothetical protein